ncbi:hypothetical protein [Actinophytocola sp.]|uniref:hypothetical protein n=1 Tax=Actinophytocola sp. TaxID=1872138 RepID=UPI002ED3C2CB
MHAEQPPPQTGRTSWRGKALAVVLAAFLMVLATLAIATGHPTRASAQAQVIATLTGTCAGGQATFRVSMANPKSGAFNFAFHLASTADPLQGVQEGEGSVAAGGTFTHDFTPVDPGTSTSWRAVFFDADAGFSMVGESNAVNPCLTTTTTTTTTTTSAATTTTTTTTRPTTSTTTTSGTAPTSTTTSDFALPTTTTTTTGAVTPAASSTNGGGLAKTGVAVLVLVGAGAVLLFNGIGLTRMTRRGWATRDDDQS